MATTESPPIGASAVEWAKRNCTEQAWWCPADNYEPVWRDLHSGSLWEYLFEGGARDGETGVVVQFNSTPPKDYRHNVGYLLDDGRSVRAFHVAGWHNDHDGYVLLKPMPTNYDRHGERRMRPDGRPVSMDTWALGPRKFFHLKVG